jgi:hypothetical protein
LGLGWALVLAVGCRPPVESAAPVESIDPGPAFEPGPLEPAEPSNKAAGDQVDLLVPGVEAEFIDLQELRGKTVILAVSGTQEAGWSALLAWMEEVQSADPETRVAVLVASDPQADALDDILSPVRLGWDPQGAVAARLSVARLPTVFILDVEGRVVVVKAGFEEADRVALESMLAAGE